MSEMTVKEFLAQQCLNKGDIEGYKYWSRQWDEVRYKMDLEELDDERERDRRNGEERGRD